MVQTFSAVALALLLGAATATLPVAETEAEHKKRIQNLNKKGNHVVLLKHNRAVEDPATATKPRLRALAPLTVQKDGTSISADEYHGQGCELQKFTSPPFPLTPPTTKEVMMISLRVVSCRVAGCGGGQNFLIDHIVQGDTTTSGVEACWAECEAELGADLVAVDAWEDSFLYDFEGVSGSLESRAKAPDCMLHFAKDVCEAEAGCEWLSSFGGRCREVTSGITPGAPTFKPSMEPTLSPPPTLQPTTPPTYFAGYKCFCQDKCECM